MVTQEESAFRTTISHFALSKHKYRLRKIWQPILYSLWILPPRKRLQDDGNDAQATQAGIKSRPNVIGNIDKKCYHEKKKKQNTTKHVYDFCFSSWYSRRSKVHSNIMTSSMEGSLKWLAPLLPWEKANQGNSVFPMITPKTKIPNSNSTWKQWTRRESPWHVHC